MDANKVKRSDNGAQLIAGVRETRPRRRWTAAEKAQILAESFFPGANISETARRYGLRANLLFRWRREALNMPSSEPPPAFVPVTVAAASPCKAGAPHCEAPEDGAAGLIEIELAGARIRLRGAVSEAQLRTALAAVRGLA